MTEERKKKQELMLRAAEIFYDVLVDGIEKGILDEKKFFLVEEKGSTKGMTVPHKGLLPTPIGIPIPQTPKKESTTKTKVTEEKTVKEMTFSESIIAIPYSFKEDGKIKSYILINEETKTYAFTPAWVINTKRLPRVEIINAAFEKGYQAPKWKTYETKFWEEDKDE